MANKFEKGAMIVGGVALAGTATFGAYEAGQNNALNQALNNRTLTAGGAMPSYSPDATTLPSGVVVTMPPATEAPVASADTVTPSASAESSAAVLSAIKIESAQAAAQRFGADVYSSNPANWEINNYGGAHLKETENAVKVKTAGAVLEGYFKAPMIGANSALTLVADSSVPMVEVNGATLWDFGPANEKAGFQQVLGQVEAKEPVEQPGVTVVPLCGDLQPVNTTSEALTKIASAEQAAQLFGADSYSSNPANWDINEYGGAHLKETGTASLVNLNGATLETWIKGNRANGRDALTFVVHANVGQMRSDGGTFWMFPNADGGFQQLQGQVIAKEAVQQPDVTVLPAYNCSVTK